MKLALGVGALALALLAACASGSSAPSTSSVATTVVEQATAVATLVDPRFNPTVAVGGGFNASTSVSTDDLNAVLGAVPQAKQLQFTAQSSPPGTRGPDVTSVSLVATDSAGVLKALDANGRRALADGVLTAAGTTWPNASISLLISDPSGGTGTVIGNRPKGGPNTILAS